MTSNVDTVFILVPGGYCPASLYHKVTDRLTKLGYTAIESDHPTTTSAHKSKATFWDDAEQVRSLASELLDQGKKVIIVGNSYGGFVVTEGVKGLSKAERAAAGKSGGLANLVYLASLLPMEMVTCTELVSKVVDVDTTSNVVVLDAPPADKVGPQLMQSLPEDEQLYYGKQLQSQARCAFHTRLTHLGYLHVPTTYIVTLQDACVAPHLQHENVDAVLATGNTTVVKRTIDSNHCAMCSHPDKLLEALVEVAERA